MVMISISYSGDLRCESVHGPSGTRLVTDAPVDNHGKGQSFSPTDLLATALGTCMTTIMAIAAKRDAVKIEGTQVSVEKIMTTTAPRRVAKLIVRFTMPVGVPIDRRAALERAAHTCPVALSMHPDTAIDVAFSYPD